MNSVDIDDLEQQELRHSEDVKLLKGILLLKIIQIQKIDRAIIFCRTKLDCDNVEE